MHLKQKSHSLDIVVGASILTALIMVWSLSQSFALLQESELSLTTSTERAKPISNSVKSTEPSPEALQFALMDDFHNRLLQTLNNFVSEEPNTFAIIANHLPTQDVAAVNGDLQMRSASLYKPFVAFQALRLVDNRQASLDEVLPNSGYTIKDCIERSISVSDNPCGHDLLHRTGLGTPAGLSVLRELGFKHTDLRGEYPVTTANDVSKLLEMVYSQNILSKSSNSILISALLAQQVNDRMPQGLPLGVKVAHKTGDLEGAVHDAGIIYAKSGDYVLVIMSETDSSGRELDVRYQRIAELTSQIHQIMESAPQIDDAS